MVLIMMWQMTGELDKALDMLMYLKLNASNNLEWHKKIELYRNLANIWRDKNN